MPKQRTPKVKVALKMTPMSFLQLLDFSNHVVKCMTGNGYFLNPTPSLATISSNVSNLAVLVAVAYHSPPTGTADRYAKRKILQDSMTALGAYVESVANLDPPNAVTIITSAGMEVKQALPVKPSGFRLKLTGVPGEVLLMTTRVRSAAYKWAYTTTPDDAASWICIENVNREILLKGLKSGQVYCFRVSVIQHRAGPWSQVIKTMVL
jgi:hypothetical protein